jgi:hypothetical protein
MWKRVHGGGATSITQVLPDEFGTQSFSFVAPDGYCWVLQQA